MSLDVVMLGVGSEDTVLARVGPLWFARLPSDSVTDSAFALVEVLAHTRPNVTKTFAEPIVAQYSVVFLPIGVTRNACPG